MNVHQTFPEPVKELINNVAKPFTEAIAMPKSVYTSEEFANLELEKIFKQEWYCVGRSDQLKEPGDYITVELAGQPLIVLRDKQGSIRALSNVCLHRMSTILEGKGNTRSIVCPYHAWTYNLDGSLRGAPAMNKNDAFCKSALKLPEVRCEEWLGWVLITLNQKAPSAKDHFGDVEELIADFDLGSYVHHFSETFDWNTNWKVLAENFMESYHLPVCHSGTIGWSADLDEMHCPESPPTFNYHTILKDEKFKLAVAHEKNTTLVGDRRRMTYLISIYPSLMITLTPGYFWYLSLHPKGAGQVQVNFGGGLSPDFDNDPEGPKMLEQTKTLLDEVNREDKGCTEKVYRGLRSNLATPGPLSHLERPNYDFARYIMEKVTA